VTLPVFYEGDADLALICSRRVLVVGYGSQGRTHALNLRDSGVAGVRVALHAGARRWPTAEADGFAPVATAEGVDWAEVVVMAAPDEVQPGLWGEAIGPNLRAGQAVLWIHGLAVNFGLIAPPLEVDVVLCCPKGAGPGIRAIYERGGGVHALVAVHQDATGRARELVLSYGAALGCGRAGMILTTFRDECECDLFGEQAVLCGGVPELIRAAWQTLVEAGYPPEVAWFETLHETKLVTDLIYEHGIAGMLARVSNTAEYGAYVTGSRVIGEASRTAMREVLADVRSGRFVQALMADHAEGGRHLVARRAAAAAEPIERVDRAIHDMARETDASAPL